MGGNLLRKFGLRKCEAGEERAPPQKILNHLAAEDVSQEVMMIDRPGRNFVSKYWVMTEAGLKPRPYEEWPEEERPKPCPPVKKKALVARAEALPSGPPPKGLAVWGFGGTKNMPLDRSGPSR